MTKVNKQIILYYIDNILLNFFINFNYHKLSVVLFTPVPGGDDIIEQFIVYTKYKNQKYD